MSANKENTRDHMPSGYDESDRKTLDALKKKLALLVPSCSKTSTESGSTSKLKKVPAPKKKSKVLKYDKDAQITKYLRTQNEVKPPQIEQNLNVAPRKSKRRKICSKDSVNNEIENVVEDKQMENPLIEYNKKLGMYIPSYKGMLKFREEFMEYKHTVESIVLEDVPPVANYSDEILKYEEECNKIPLLDCKHMSVTQIEHSFSENKQYITDITKGQIYCKRHLQYITNNYSKQLCTKNLIYNTSLITFSFEQVELLIDLMKKHLKGLEVPVLCHTDYYFKVLLPELCLKIFMKEHKMDHNEAVEYLDKRPPD